MSIVLETVGHVKCDCVEVIENIANTSKTSFIDKELNYTIRKMLLRTQKHVSLHFNILFNPGLYSGQMGLMQHNNMHRRFDVIQLFIKMILLTRITILLQ